MNSLEQKVSRYRKLTEMIEELGDSLAPLKAEAGVLADDIFSTFSANRSLYNVGVFKTFAIGFVGRELVRIDFSEKITRAKGSERDQEWLKSLLSEKSTLAYVRLEPTLDKASIKVDLARGTTSEADLKRVGIVAAPSYKVKVSRVRKDAELATLIEQARAEAEAEEDGE